jgi:putative ABC transport system permease protein
VRLSSVAHLYWIWLKARRVLSQQLLAGLGLAVGVALLFASQIASASLNGSVRAVTSELVSQMQFQLDSRDLEGFDQRLLGEVRGLPGVRVAVPVLQEPVTLTGPTGRRTVELIGTQVGVALNASPLLRNLDFGELGLLRRLLLPAPVAEHLGVRTLASNKLQFGRRTIAEQSDANSRAKLKLWFDGRTVSARFGRALDAKDVPGLVDSPVALASLAYAQELTGMEGRITRVFVRASPGHDREVHSELMSLAAGSLNVEPANFDTTLFAVAAAPANQSQGLFSGISALVGFLFAFNAMLLTLPMRRSLIATLRVNGATRADIAKLLALDGLTLGLLASLLGLALGDALSLAVFRSNPGYLSLAFPVGSQRIITWQSAALATGAGIAAAYVGVLIALPRTSSPRPGRLREREGRHTRRGSPFVALPGGALCVALTTVVLIDEPQLAILGSVSLVFALLSLLPFTLDMIVGIFDRLQIRFGYAASRLAVVELRSPKTWARSIAIAATGAVAVFGSVALEGAKANLQSGLERSTHDIAGAADLWIVPSGGHDVLATVPFAENPSLELAGQPGVRSVGPYRASFLDYGARRVWVVAPPASTANPIPPSQLAKGSLAVATARLRAGGWAVVSQALAEQHHMHIGQLFSLPSPRPATLRLAAMSTNLGWPPGAVILNPQDYARAWGTAEIGAYTVLVSPGASLLATREQLLRALGPGSGLAVETARHREQSMRSATRQGLSRLSQIATLVLIAAALAMSTAMGAMIWQRRVRLARLKVQGYPRGVLWRALVCESVLLLGGGCLVGAVFGVYGQLLISHALGSVTGFPIVYTAGAWVAILSTVTVSGAAVLIVGLVGYRAASVPPGV